MTATPNFASGAAAGGTEIGALAATAASTAPFVLNLCSSTTPMALAQIDLPELRRFTFFVSRRFEEGRERFRLHMGYFATLAEAEEWLNLVREIYPGAWAGEAPGRKLRERAAAANAAQAQHAAGPQPRAAAGVREPAPALPPPAVRVPVVHAAPPVARAAAPAVTPPIVSPPAASGRFPGRELSPLEAALAKQQQHAPQTVAKPQPSVAKPQPPRAPVAKPQSPQAAAARPQPSAPPRPAVRAPVAAAPQAPVRTPAPARSPAVPAAPARVASAAAPVAASRPAPPAPAAKASPVAAPIAKTPPAAAPAGARARAFEDSNVREVLKALGDASATGETRLMRAPSPPQAKPESPREASPPPASGKGPLSDTQVLKVLELRREEGSDPVPVEVDDGGIPLLKPDDTGTRLALKDAVANNTAVAFAVQLQWSVQPVELDKVPPLAIFSAYTLYTVEGSRDGRRWYGLRLGFFSDAISAKQVAYYVRSEFASVAVLPVSPQEKARATDQDMAAARTAAAPARPDPMDEFKLIDDTPALPVPAGPPVAAAKGAEQPGAPARPKVAVGRTLPQPPGKPRPRPPAKVAAREQRGPQTLEETLEILGASELSIDTGNGETLNESGVRHLRVEMQKNSPFARLLERLSDKLKKP
jgi:hypothetical protein